MYRLLVLLLCGLSIASCTDDPLLPGHNPMVTIQNLPPLPVGFHYEIWVSTPPTGDKINHTGHGETPYVSIGTFTVGTDRIPRGLNGNAPTFVIPASVKPGLLADALVSVEDGSGGHGPERILLAGDFVGSETRAFDTLTMVGRQAFKGLLTSGFSTFVLDAPTSDSPIDSARGLWFIDIRRDPVSGDVIDTIPGLNLRALPVSTTNTGWAYQPWLVRYESGQPAEYIGLGQFTNPTTSDSDGAGPGAGAHPTRHYSVPGSDFVTGVVRTLNDGNYGVIVSLEPEGSVLSRPCVELLSRTIIDANLPSRRSVELISPASAPRVLILLDR